MSSYLTEQQKRTAVELVESAGQYAKQLNEQLSNAKALGTLDRKSLQELPHRVAAINAQAKAGTAMIAAEMAFGQVEGATKRLDEKSHAMAMLGATGERAAESKANGRAAKA